MIVTASGRDFHIDNSRDNGISTVPFLALICTAMNSRIASSTSERLHRQIARKSADTTCNIMQRATSVNLK